MTGLYSLFLRVVSCGPGKDEDEGRAGEEIVYRLEVVCECARVWCEGTRERRERREMKEMRLREVLVVMKMMKVIMKRRNTTRMGLLLSKTRTNIGFCVNTHTHWTPFGLGNVPGAQASNT